MIQIIDTFFNMISRHKDKQQDSILDISNDTDCSNERTLSPNSILTLDEEVRE